MSSIEEDIKTLKDLMENVELTFGGWIDVLTEKEKKALRNLLSDYTKEKQTNKEIKEKVKKLEKENCTLKSFTSAIFNENIEKEFVPTQKIKDKIKEIEKEENLYAKNNIIKILEELLEDK